MFQRLLEAIATQLDRRSMAYMIIGGQALLVYGEPRFTRDIDVTLGVDSQKLDELLEIAKKSGWKILVENPQEFVNRTMVLPCLDEASGIRIDFIFSRSPYEAQAMKRVNKMSVGKVQVCYASPEDLIIHKMIAARPRDLEDVRNILLKGPDLDEGYLKHWLKEFERALSQPLLKQLEQIRKDISKA